MPGYFCGTNVIWVIFFICKSTKGPRGHNLTNLAHNEIAYWESSVKIQLLIIKAIASQCLIIWTPIWLRWSIAICVLSFVECRFYKCEHFHFFCHKLPLITTSCVAFVGERNTFWIPKTKAPYYGSKLHNPKVKNSKG